MYSTPMERQYVVFTYSTDPLTSRPYVRESAIAHCFLEVFFGEAKFRQIQQR